MTHRYSEKSDEAVFFVLVVVFFLMVVCQGERNKKHLLGLQTAEWDGAKKLDTTISQEAILKDTGVTRKCDNIQKNSNAK